MATDTTDTEQQLDEFGEPIPTDQELAKEQSDQEAERMKTDQTIQLVGAMNQTVAPLPMMLPTQPSPVQAPTLPIGATPPLINRGGQVSIGSTLVAPPTAPQGRSYMGPAMSPEQEAAFMQSPAGTNQNLTPGMTPDRWAAKTQPTVTHAPPPEMLANMNRYESQRTIQEAVKNGTPMQDAIQLYGEGLFPSLNTATRPMTEYQGKNLELRTQQLSQSDARTKEYQRLSQEAANNKLTPQTALESKDLYTQKAMLQGLINSPNTNPKKVSELKTQLDAVTARIKELFPSASFGTVQPPVSAATRKSTGKRVKVTGPGGRKGTIEEGDTLPDGWKLAK